MKKLFTLAAFIAVSCSVASAQDATTTTRPTKVVAKESLKKVESEPRKIESAKQAAQNRTVKRIDSQNQKAVVLTPEQMKARSEENRSNAVSSPKKGEQ